MLASIFSKTRPINYLLLGTTLILFYVMYLLADVSWTQNPWLIGLKAGILLLLAASALLVGFVALRNTLTRANSYAMLFFVMFLLLFPTLLVNTKIVVANFFLLLALRRLISLQSLISPKEKIFDASFWIIAASLFHFWCIIYLVLVFISIVFHVSRDYRNWLIPFIACGAVAVIYMMFGLMVGHGLFEQLLDEMSPSFDFGYFENIYQRIALSLFAPVAALFAVPYVFAISSKPLNLQSGHKKILYSFLIGLGIFLLSNHKNNSFLAFTFAPLAIMGANFVEVQENKWTREATVWGVVAVCVLIFLLQL